MKVLSFSYCGLAVRQLQSAKKLVFVCALLRSIGHQSDNHYVCPPHMTLLITALLMQPGCTYSSMQRLVRIYFHINIRVLQEKGKALQ